MTSQEFEVKRRSRVARIWQNRRERWAAWKAEKEANWNRRSHGAPHGFACHTCGLPLERWKERSCQVVQHTTL